MLTDKEIRSALIKKVSSYSDTNVLEEFSLTTDPVRADLVTINGHLTGFEIKSDVDSLERLPHQIEGYDKFFEMNYLVVGQKLKDSALKMIPNHWGVFLAYRGENNKVILKRFRIAKKNPNFNFTSFLFIMPMQDLKKEIVPLLSEEQQKQGKRMIKQDLIRFLSEKLNQQKQKKSKKIVRENIRKQPRTI